MTLTEIDTHTQSPINATNTSSNVLLGNIANISSADTTNSAWPQQKYTLSSTQRKKQRRLRLLDAGRRILRNHNIKNTNGNKSHKTRQCLAVRYDKTQDIEIYLNDNPDNSKAGLGNLVTCGSICSCPVCAYRRMLEHAENIKKALIWAKTEGYVPLLVSLTAEHHKGMKLNEFKDSFRDAWNYFSSGRDWRRLKADYNIKQYITAREITRGRVVDNGWHYHMHVLMFVDSGLLKLRDDLPDITTPFRDRWMHALQRNNLNGIDKIACDVRSGSHVGEMYLTKLGVTETTGGKLEYELTGAANKGASIWDILEDAAFGDIEAEYLYLEYVEAMKGHNWITFSHGFKKLIEDIELESGESSDDEKLKLWYWISQENWSLIVRKNEVATVLMLAAKYRCYSTINEFIRMLKDDG